MSELEKMRVLKECNGDVDNAAYRLIEINGTGNEAVFNFYEEEEERNSITFLHAWHDNN